MTSLVRCGAIPILLLICTSACSGLGFPEPAVAPDDRLEQLQIYLGDELIEAYEAPSTSDAERLRIRNRLINGRVAAVDIQFNRFLQDLHTGGVNLNVGTDAATIGLGTAGALISGGTSQILSGISGGIVGLKQSVDKNALFEQTTQALAAQMIASRKQVLVRIRGGLLTTSIDEYPLTQGLADLEDYYYAGTILGAITGVVESAGQQARQADQQMEALTGAFVIDPPGDLLQQFWMPNRSEIDPANAATIRQWMDEHGLADEPSIQFFIRSDNYAEAREQAVRDLNLR